MPAAEAAHAGSAVQVYAELRAAIVDHRLPPGTKLREQEIAASFGVSRTVVREVLIGLIRDRLVVQEPKRTAQVARPAWSEARHVFAARQLIEGELVSQLASAATARDVAALREAMALEQAAVARADRAESIRLSGEFHLQLARAAGNPVLYELLRDLVSRTSLLFAMYQQKDAPMCVAHHHGALLDAIASGDVARAAGEMRAHLLELETRLAPLGSAVSPTLARLLGRDVQKRRKSA
ncbi:GntR family transcriptional regulator [Verticiella sediminum]|uniref:GntR family transcriptional regulator n=1 Tax=Verticiella sediminum TaxID=1247510 RepID=UPI0014792454|nr:GntR family transcriptional regulator [Verticiella sediminum]